MNSEKKKKKKKHFWQVTCLICGKENGIEAKKNGIERAFLDKWKPKFITESYLYLLEVDPDSLPI